MLGRGWWWCRSVQTYLIYRSQYNKLNCNPQAVNTNKLELWNTLFCAQCSVRWVDRLCCLIELNYGRQSACTYIHLIDWVLLQVTGDHSDPCESDFTMPAGMRTEEPCGRDTNDLLYYQRQLTVVGPVSLGPASYADLTPIHFKTECSAWTSQSRLAAL